MADRTRHALLALAVLAAVAFLAAVAALTVPGAAGRLMGWVAVGLVMAGPLLRVVVVARTWTRPPDRRFLAAVALLLLALGTAAVLTAW